MRLFIALLPLLIPASQTSHGAGEDFFTMRITLHDLLDTPINGLSGLRVELTQFPSGNSAMSGAAMEISGTAGEYDVRFRKATRYANNTADLEKQTWQISVSASGYKLQFLGPLGLRVIGDRIVPVESGERMKLKLLRDGRQWRAEFACHTRPVEQLPAAVQKLKRILDGTQDSNSGPREIYLQVKRAAWRNAFGKPASIGIGTLSGIQFHQLGTEKNPRQADRARAAMLNIAHALDTKAKDGCSLPVQPASPDWLAWVQRILLVSEERVIARVSADLYKKVFELEKNEPAYSCQSTISAGSALHTFDDSNLRRELRIGVAAKVVRSIKTPLCRGNVQITVAKFQTPEGEVILADFDIDENFATGAHFWDLIFHAGSGRGTDAYEVHEMLLARGGHQPQELGYTLAPLGSPSGESCPDPGRTPLTTAGTAAGPN